MFSYLIVKIWDSLLGRQSPGCISRSLAWGRSTSHDEIEFHRDWKMWAASDPNMRFHHRTASPSSHNHQILSFQPVYTEMNFPCTSGVHSTTGMAFAGDTGGTSDRSVLIPVGSAQRSPQLHPVPGLKYDTGFTADWSFEEQSLLEESLVK